MQDLYSENSEGEIATCNLAAIVVGRAESDEEYEDACYYALKMIDDVIEIGNYPFPSLRRSAKARRNAGVGMMNLAHDLASKGLNYTSAESKAYIHRVAERHSYFLHKASIRLAKERGPCEWLYKTKYPDGWLPIDTYKKTVDKITDQKLVYDWEALRKEGLKHGYRFSVLEAFMPGESSSQASGTTNSVYPVRGLVIEKKDGNKITTFIAPDADLLADKYQLASQINTRDIIEMYALFQKFCGQTLSSDYWPKDKEIDGKNGRKFSADEAFNNYLLAKRYGVKTRYYTNTENNADMEETCVGGACKL